MLFIQPVMPRPYSDFFSDFLEILRPRNRDLKNTHGTFRGRHVQVYASFQQAFSKRLYAFGDFPFRQKYTSFWGRGGGGSRNERKLEDEMVNFTNFIFEIIFRAYANLPLTKDLC